MVIEDNFIEVLPGHLVDPVLHLTLAAVGNKEAYAFDEADLILKHDAGIGPGRLTTKPDPDERARRLRHPMLADFADEEELLVSDKCLNLIKFYLKWSMAGGVLRITADNILEHLIAIRDSIVSEGVLENNLNPPEVFLYAIQSIVKLSKIRDQYILKAYPDVIRIEVCVRLELARDFFGLSVELLEEVESGWVCVSSREVVR